MPTFDIAAGANFAVPGGTYTGGTTFNVGAGAAVTIGAYFTGGAIFNLGTGSVVTMGEQPDFLRNAHRQRERHRAG